MPEAACRHQPLVVRLLLRAKASVDAADAEGNTALHVAASPSYGQYGGALRVTQLLLGAGAAVNFARANGYTALHSAALYGHAAGERMLLDAHAAVDVAGQDGYTPLHLAAKQAEQGW